MRTLGDHLRKRRLDLGLLQQEVAEQLGTSEATITNWEVNHTTPQLRFVPEIVAFLGYDPNDGRPGTLSERIVRWRHLRGISQKEMAQRLGIDPSTLGRWERGDGKPSMRLAQRLGALLGTSH